MEPLLAITDKAQQKVLGFREGVADAERQAMWVEVTGVKNGEWTYNISLKPVDGAGPDDSLQYADDLGIVVPEADVEKLHGATVDWSDDLMSGGLLVVNPNKPDPASPAIGGRPPVDLSGPVPQRVMQVLADQINPAIAAHGGSAELVAVEEDTAYVRLGGGCVGCGMASVTLGQGIEVAIVEAVPEVRQVVDVTDHASGTNPYYEAAKK
ncbi:MAG: Fe/S biosis protein NfuA [Thermoleophilaceae bacterium]|jgi:Fe/S biogenesis protein NfuA|nr:Fe/S biosis protein NfuA [Thermoleophilaceae bacterium]